MNLIVLEIAKVLFKCYLFNRRFANEARTMNCVSRRDDPRDKNIFVQENGRKGHRWNLYSQTVIENNTLKCSNETYSLTKLCQSDSLSQPCTLLDTNEVVDIGQDFFS